MNTAGQTADQIANMGLKYTEKAAELAGEGLLNLATFLIRYLEQDKQVSGLTNLKNLIDGKQKPKIYELNKDKLADFKVEAKKYGVLYTVIEPKDGAKADVIISENSLERFMRVLDVIGYDEPYKIESPNAQTLLAPSESELSERGDTQTPQTLQEKERVRVRVERVKLQMGSPFDNIKPKSIEEEK
jgi:hypothetical protein